MKLKEKIGLMVFISLAGCIYCPAQNYDFYKKQAYTSFDNGEYEKAQKALNVYNEMTGNKVTGLSEKIARCVNYQTLAKEAESSGDYVSAKSYYESILKYNPKDPNVSATIARLNKLIAKSQEEKRVAAAEAGQSKQEIAKKQAYTSFDNGEYEKAQKALNVYNEMTGNKDTGLSEKIARCVNYQTLAKEAESSGDYASAKSYYESILKYNPKDPDVSATIARLNKLIAKSQEEERVAAAEAGQSKREVVVSEQDFTTVSPVKLEKNKTKFLPSKKIGYSLFLLSQFDSKGMIGVGFTAHRSYFQLGADVILSNPNSWQVDKIENEYIYPKIQITTSPGMNFTYFSMEIGVGMYINENVKMTYKPEHGYIVEYYGGDRNGQMDYIIDREEQFGNVTKKTKCYCIIRPTIMGYIPFGKYSNEISIRMGYNFVSKDLLNGFIFGVGYYF